MRQAKTYDLEGPTQTNAFLTSSKSAVMAQLAQMTENMDDIQAQLKKLTPMSKNPTRANKTIYCWSCGSNFTHGSKTSYDQKTGHKEGAYYKNQQFAPLFNCCFL